MANTYSTTDIVLAATLKTRGYLLSALHVIGRRGTFTFEDVPPSELEGYHKGYVTVVPVVFHRALRDLTIQINKLIETNV